MKVAISQPTYLPWVGYFDLVDQVDAFVFLDNVQFEKRSWQQRNRIKGPGGLILLTVPVSVKGHFEQTVAQAAISDPDGWRKHLRAIEMNYRSADNFAKYWAEFCEVLEAGWRTVSLCDLNIALIRWCMEKLSIQTPLSRASAMPCQGKRSELLASICEHLAADSYLSPFGSAGYLLNEEMAFERKRIDVQFQHYIHPDHEQLFPPFVPYASVIDLLFNIGNRALDVVRRGRRTSFSIAEMRRISTGELAGEG